MLYYCNSTWAFPEKIWSLPGKARMHYADSGMTGWR